MNVILEIFDKYLKKMENCGLLLIDAPTGFGKSKSIEQYIIQNYNSIISTHTYAQIMLNNKDKKREDDTYGIIS